MFDALRRAEAERRRKLGGERTPPSAIVDRLETPAVEAPPRGEVALPRPTLSVPGPAVNGSDPFPGELLRELGILRNAIEAKLEKKPKRVLMFTSAMHGEGVTTLAIAYARLLAMHGEGRVLLLEMNARAPSLAARLGLVAPGGVTHYFTAQRPLASLVQRPPHDTFDVVHVGEWNPTEVQINLERAFPRLLEEALRSHDTIVIDAAPVVLSPETPPLAPFVDGSVVVVHCARTKRETVERSIKQIQQAQGRVLGIVLNRKRYYIPDFIYRRL